MFFSESGISGIGLLELRHTIAEIYLQKQINVISAILVPYSRESFVSAILLTFQRLSICKKVINIRIPRAIFRLIVRLIFEYVK